MENYVLSILVLVIALIGLGLITGIVSITKAINLIWIIVFIAIFWPFAASFAISLYKSLPTWVSITISIMLSLIIVSALLRGFLSLFIGREATGVFVGELALRVFALPFRFVGYLFWLATGRRRNREE